MTEPPNVERFQILKYLLFICFVYFYVYMSVSVAMSQQV